MHDSNHIAKRKFIRGLKTSFDSALLFSFIILFSHHCSRKGEFVFSGKTMGTSYNVRLHSESALTDRNEKEIQKAIQSELDRIDSLLSNWNPDSEINQFNRWPARKEFNASKDLSFILQKASEVHQKSGGAFDPTISPLIELWGFGSGKSASGIPDQSELNSALLKSGMNKLEIKDNHLVKIIPELNLNLSAIAKGYAVDRVHRMLSDMGYVRIMVEVGGEIRTGQPPPGKEYWKIGIEKPDYSGEKSVYRILALKDNSIATSGDYRNFFRVKDKNFTHIINPADGMPVNGDVISASVIGPDCMTADALATTLLVMDPERGLNFLSSFRGYEGFLILKKAGGGFEEKFTPGMKNLFEKTDRIN